MINMVDQMNSSNYVHIARAITYITENKKHLPSLAMIANHMQVSDLDFERIVREWGDITPKQFLQYIQSIHAKSIMCYKRISADEAGLSDDNHVLRLHKKFVEIEAMSPYEYKEGGSNLEVFYSIHESPFGQILIASTNKGICHLSFLDDESDAIQHLQKQFYRAKLSPKVISMHREVLKVFNKKTTHIAPIKLHLYGTPFQIKVWKALLNIPNGKLCSYGDIAKIVGNHKASRAVGTAIGSNNIAFLIPCHRVVQSSGITGGYRWNPIRKIAIIAWESSSKF